MGVTIIGAGNMARGIGSRLVAAGEALTLIDRTPENAVKLAQELRAGATSGATVEGAPLGGTIPDDIVVLALYYPVEKEVVT
ncbi:MAG TPA: NAD(P)-binding domain-containing protein, partial [Ktedonobacterales bacterium]